MNKWFSFHYPKREFWKEKCFKCGEKFKIDDMIKVKNGFICTSCALYVAGKPIRAREDSC
jgi:DNA-directed RNA polymerase subunit RPC12/RpoP